VLLPEMRLDRVQTEMPNFRWSPQAKTITDMRRRDCNLPLRDHFTAWIYCTDPLQEMHAWTICTAAKTVLARI
jgi:hypothetical protein